MEEFIKIMQDWTKEYTDELIEKIERKEKLNNYEKSYIYFFMKYVERKKNENINTRNEQRKHNNI